MTFFDISRKMLKAGFYKYRLYFLCNLSATALFCCFAVISTNRTFMNASIVNSSISNNIYLPFFLSAVFLVFFLPVSCQAFLASRKQEYGVMFSLGMSRKEAFRNLLFENVIISVLALAIALAAGTVLSFLFFSSRIMSNKNKSIMYLSKPLQHLNIKTLLHYLHSFLSNFLADH